LREIVLTLEPNRKPPSVRLLSIPEQPFPGGVVDQRGWFADLFFRDAKRTYGLLIEAKLGARATWKQIPDYVKVRSSRLELRDDAQSRGSRNRHSLTLALPADRARARWLGCATWQEVVDELEGIEFADDERAKRWQELLRCYPPRARFRNTA
jgi:hypothetical protein